MSEASRESRPLRVESWGLDRVARAVGGELEHGGSRRPTGVSTDTRTLEEGELFVALRGDRFDGHEFIGESVDEGAVGAVVRQGYQRSSEVPESFPVLRVRDTVEALGALGEALWREAHREGLHTIDVTGSNGKTTTKEMLAAIWATEGSVYSTPGNYNNEIGLPLTLCELPRDVDHLVVELAANAPGEISELIELAPGEERLITSIGRDHLEGFGSVDGVRRSKAEIFEYSDGDTLGVVPAGERERLPLEEMEGNVWTFGSEEAADLRLVDYRRVGGRAGRYLAEFETGRGRRELALDFPGRYNGDNLACALSTMVARGLEPDYGAIQSKLSGIELPGGRWRVSKVGALEVIDDAYNANPTSVRASFSAFLDAEPESIEEGRSVQRIAVLGEMRELGEAAERLHREVAGDLAEAPRIDELLFVGARAEVMAEAAMERRAGGKPRIEVCDEPGEVIDVWRGSSPAFVWLKGSRSNQLERVVEQLRARHRDE